MTDWATYLADSNRTLFNQSLGFRRLMELILEHTPAKGRILEAGCGTALLSLLLADSGFDVTAMDSSEEVLEYAKHRCCLASLKLEFVRGDILELSAQFGWDRFDVICHSGVLEHFSDADIVKSLREHRKVSRCVIFSVPNNRVKLTASHFGDERLMCNKTWLRLIRQAGYSEISVHGGYDVPLALELALPGALFKRRLFGWSKWMSKHSLFVCR